MLLVKTVAIAAGLVPLAGAHGSTRLPKIMGVDLLERRAANLIASLRTGAFVSADLHDVSALQTRKDDRECGEGIGSCPQDKCCSVSGYCGTTDDHCRSPNCQWQYGPACPENQTPEGKNTSSIPRPKLGTIPYGGVVVSKCTVPGTVALTFDDGPYKHYTDRILDLMKSYDAKATFFVTGNNNNKGQIDKTEEHINAIKRIDAEGHQIASHTWTHQNLTKISSEDRKNQMWRLEMALNNIVGKIPTYMRPPYLSCKANCPQDMSELGYHIIEWDVDTDDYNQNDPSLIQNSKDWFKGNITKSGATPQNSSSLAISHDILDQTANNLTENMLSTLTQLGYKAVTVGECLGDGKENWYRQFDNSSSNGTATSNSPEASRTPGSSTPEQSTSSALLTFHMLSSSSYFTITLFISTFINLI
ncbi:hypothetical protein OPT61_g7122 [Boeremia exigua]|uniref:Uncharacterized protein n=1 Tax=Boeremia exigua TaxID=749465 RepID=A0ACC2I4J5_9PLEO|nr:hypothetical protein OPT61_g7122 [Boeremia exigua]